ncbi:multidrug efflux RND transporter permease subunit [Methylobacterium sp. WL30]|jgi:multidrug efflux pump|uniref:multidrug efflux RND transporter permease subunit n=1 Tax=unclassified Methylobacterium TaxID=2615210 RepID=UPI0011C71E6F|nr:MULTISPECIES: multidrug efflux RND transporter permease subunit [unclassified Methylobacterium]MCJ2112920.1 multidrug efflux RND transporter permease subunit [Methylobacterium sp. E-025]TXM91023.1 multidrug efflux RND transporter permease subunit [Methylobacterium sp. WL116]TXN34180.1 multidrug efflux RND transporter permease subunit [Methylobacterium sp. WL93]TXN51193.1 multidrug efflux RND transporter permease subunit [Methylobacterium sp. WL119]TXN62216.1 multidrug efflux RND transporter
MARFFIDRPVFAWVVALFIILGGALALPLLPVAQYPVIAPPAIALSTAYPGASVESLYTGTTRLIEDELNGAANIMSFESTSDSFGAVNITATFQPGTDPALASVEVQNRLKRVEARLPAEVRQQGILVEEASAATLNIITLVSTDGKMDEIGLGDFLIRNVINEIRRIPGVGRATLYSTERSLRIWVDPDKLRGLSLTAENVTDAIRNQNIQVASGAVGAQPSPYSQAITAPIIVKGQLASVDDFGAIVLRANSDGSNVRLRDVARIELGGDAYQFSTRLNGGQAAGISVTLAPDGNALETAGAIRKKMEELSQFFPPGLKWDIPYDITPAVKASIEKVLHTLVEAVVLVFVVMFLFLQNIRYTLIPTIVVPIALMGTCCTMLLAGFSINVLTMFGMVLAIGILVDDAIVVVENVERIMTEEGLSPKDATKKAMDQITGAIIGITLVLIAVFIPMAFFPGSVGIIYRQFSIAMVTSIAFSAVLALSLTPALCATLLKPVAKGHGHSKGGVFGWFNRIVDRETKRYGRGTAWFIKKSGRVMIVYLALVAGVAFAFARLPEGFLPLEDQGFFTVDIQTPPGASFNRTQAAVRKVEEHLLAQPGVATVTMLNGFSFSGQGSNTSQAFVTLKPWGERDAANAASALVAGTNKALSGYRDAIVDAQEPPPVDNLGNAAGFSFRLQDRAQKGYSALLAAQEQLLKLAMQSPVLQKMKIEGLPPAPEAELVIDREKAAALGVKFEDINATIQVNLGSVYTNDFPNRGKMQRVIVQSEDLQRMQATDILNYGVKNASGTMVPMSSFADLKWSVGPQQIVGFNGYQSVRITGEPNAGYTSGDAIAEMERLMGQLPKGFGYTWTGQSLQEKQAGSQASLLLALSVLIVFLCLAALYESWAIPVSVLLVIPLGVIGSVAAVYLRGLPNDVYFKIGLITIIGLSAKNAILIVEFAKDLWKPGTSIVDATIEAATLRFRPIVMTSLAFIFGVVPLAIATGAASKSQQAIGTGVMGGMISATILAVFFVPVFFVVVMRLFRRKDVLAGEKADAATPAVRAPGGHGVPAE